MVAHSRLVVSCPAEMFASLASPDLLRALSLSPAFSSPSDLALHALTASEESAEFLRRSWTKNLAASEGLEKAAMRPVIGLSILRGRVEVSSPLCHSIYNYTTDLQSTFLTPSIEVKEFGLGSLLTRDCSVSVRQNLLIYKGSVLRDLVVTTPTVILSGSFNPLHIAHVELVQRACQLVGAQDFLFELTVKNADKGGISETELKSRVAQFEALDLPLILTDAPLFIDKLKHFQK